MVRSLVQLVCGAIVLVTVAVAGADPLPTRDGAPDGFFIGRATPSPLLVGAFGAGMGALGRSPHGLFLGIETGWASWRGRDAVAGRREVVQPEAPSDAWTFGARVGYQWRSGLAVQLRFDDLGVAVSRGGGSLLVGSGGLRYSLPFAIMPFAEALFAAVFDGSGASPAGGLGVGVSAPVARHLSIDLAVRDWIADLGGSVCHLPTVMVGINIGFGG